MYYAIISRKHKFSSFETMEFVKVGEFEHDESAAEQLAELGHTHFELLKSAGKYKPAPPVRATVVKCEE
jgi:hypothetical protein